MHLHVSLEEVHRFTGAEGHEEARRVYPILQEWAKTSDSRDAVSRAAQIVAAAKQIGAGYLRDFYAIVLYQAGLTLWSFGVLSNAANTVMSPDGTVKSGSPPGLQKRVGNVAVLDGTDSSAVQRFIAMNRGQSAITSRTGSYTLLSDPGSVMGVLIDIFETNHKAQHSLPPLVSNLTSLMEGLRTAVSG